MRTALGVLGSMAALCLLGYGAVFVLSERALRDYDPPAPFRAAIPTDSATLSASGRDDLGLMTTVARDPEPALAAEGGGGLLASRDVAHPHPPNET
ncbi:MAG: hypothetical protein RH859_11215 [Longimicrobiales bacterium]